MTLISQSLLRTTFLSGILIVLSFIYLFHGCKPTKLIFDNHIPLPSHSGDHLPFHQQLNLNDQQCRTAFPNIFSEIDTKIAQGPFLFSPSNPDYRGLVQARITNNQLSILSTSPLTSPLPLHQRLSTLSQIHRALLTSPSMLPNTTIAFSINDVPKNNTWAYSRPNKNSTYNIWLMPLFNSWSWPAHGLGTMDDILDRISAVEDDMTWDEKIDQAVWRGTSWFNPLGYPNLRKDLLRATKGKEWADILALEGSEDANALSIEEFCRYKYVVYTEGVTYSGRLPYHQACGSVLVMAPMTWVTVSGLMLKPIWGAELMKGGVGMDEERSDVGKEELVEIEASGNLAMVHRYEDANAVYVKPDFSDLEALVEFLRESEHVARRIARNQRETMVGGGYLTSAAETCYWKALIRGWASKASIKEEAWTTLKEERYETWLLKEVNREIQNVRGRSL